MKMRAGIRREWDLALPDRVRLYLYDEVYGGRYNVLLEDGTWQTVEEGAETKRAGLVLPGAAVDAIMTAIEEFQGRANHGATEARVLREWLAVEQRRVDDALHR